MRELKIIYGEDCSRCHQMMNFLPKWCESNGFMYTEENREKSIYKDEIESLPMLILKIEDKGGTGKTEVKKLTMEEFISEYLQKWK